MSRTLSIALLAALLLFGAAAGARAQDATPTPDPLFSGLGLPELVLTATPDILLLSQNPIPAGRYVVTLVDQSGGEPVPPFIEFLRLAPEDADTSDRHCKGGLAPDCFAWYTRVFLPGGVSAAAPRAILELQAGEYGLWGAGLLMEVPAARLTVTGDATAAVSGPEPEAATLTFAPDTGGERYTIHVEGTLRSGRHLVRVVNAADRPYFLYAGQYPGPITVAAVATTQAIERTGGVGLDGATPGPDALDPERFRLVGFSITQSPGTQQWVVLDLAPGQVYLAGYYPVPFNDQGTDTQLGVAVVAPVAGP
ncbi:MAG: hypothetical protein U0031_11140 [Thermomicrobiales bacterium]